MRDRVIRLVNDWLSNNKLNLKGEVELKQSPSIWFSPSTGTFEECFDVLHSELYTFPATIVIGSEDGDITIRETVRKAMEEFNRFNVPERNI